MKKDKLITIRVSEETREKFNDWCEANHIKGSSFLSDIINGCLKGSISPDIASQSIDKSASQKIVELEDTVNSLSSRLNTLKKNIYNKIDKSIDNILEQKIAEYEVKVYSLHSQLENLDNRIDRSIEEPTETAELDEVEEKAIIPEKSNNQLTDDSRRAKSKEKADKVKSADKPTHEGSIDDNVETEDLISSQVLSGYDLMERFGKDRKNNSHSRARKKGKEHFIKWSRKLDPVGYSWWLVDEDNPKKGYKIIS